MSEDTRVVHVAWDKWQAITARVKELEAELAKARADAKEEMARWHETEAAGWAHAGDSARASQHRVHAAVIRANAASAANAG